MNAHLRLLSFPDREVQRLPCASRLSSTIVREFRPRRNARHAIHEKMIVS
jgi:hypothetical protein